MSASLHYAMRTSFMNSEPLSVLTPSNGIGIASMRRLNASTTNDESRATRATHSVHPVATSVSVSVCT
jgi:hypothetical protein